MSNYTFIKNPELLEEDYRVNDLLDFSTNINELTEQLIGIKKNSMVGLVGPYGCGKSTILYQLYREYSDKKNGYGNPKINATNLEEVNDAKWFTFDAWQYPERKDLWDGFVIEFAGILDKKYSQKIKKEIDGDKNSKTKTTTKAVAAAGSIFGLGNITGTMKEVLLDILSSPPLKRVFEFQELLARIIHKIDKKIYIIVEDIDRSGDKGIFFLETLSHFIKNIGGEHEIIVIVPMGDEVFKEQGNRNARNSYLKILDYQVDFNPQDINFVKFIDSVIKFNSDYGNNASEVISKFLSHIIRTNEGVTIRDIKHLIRRADQNYNLLKDSDDESIDIMLVLLFTATRYFYVKNDDKEKYYLESIQVSSKEQSHTQRIIAIPTSYWVYKEIIDYLIQMSSKFLDSKDYVKPEGSSPILLLSEDKSDGSMKNKIIIYGTKVEGIELSINLSEKYLRLIPDELIKRAGKNKYFLKEHPMLSSF